MSADRPRPLVAGNWKMNGRMASAKVLNEIREGYTPGLKGKADLLVCPPVTLLHIFAHMALGSRIAEHTSWASSGVATSPVPMAQTGS